MSKKSLLNGLESLFEPDNNDFQASNPLLATTTKTKAPAKQSVKKGKSFAADLDAFFEGSNASAPKKRTTTRRKNPLLGIDALIRKTFDDQANPEDKAKRLKRLTLSLNIDMVSELKRIAREQNKLVSQLVAELVELYYGKNEKK